MDLKTVSGPLTPEQTRLQDLGRAHVPDDMLWFLSQSNSTKRWHLVIYEEDQWGRCYGIGVEPYCLGASIAIREAVKCIRKAVVAAVAP